MSAEGAVALGETTAHIRLRAADNTVLAETVLPVIVDTWP